MTCSTVISSGSSKTLQAKDNIKFLTRCYQFYMAWLVLTSRCSCHLRITQLLTWNLISSYIVADPAVWHFLPPAGVSWHRFNVGSWVKCYWCNHKAVWHLQLICWLTALAYDQTCTSMTDSSKRSAVWQPLAVRWLWLPIPSLGTAVASPHVTARPSLRDSPLSAHHPRQPSMHHQHPLPMQWKPQVSQDCKCSANTSWKYPVWLQNVSQQWPYAIIIKLPGQGEHSHSYHTPDDRT